MIRIDTTIGAGTGFQKGGPCMPHINGDEQNIYFNLLNYCCLIMLRVIVSL